MTFVCQEIGHPRFKIFITLHLYIFFYTLITLENRRLLRKKEIILLMEKNLIALPIIETNLSRGQEQFLHVSTNTIADREYIYSHYDY